LDHATAAHAALQDHPGGNIRRVWQGERQRTDPSS
jgi:hypothetical protein